jgi:hypothetical protein
MKNFLLSTQSREFFLFVFFFLVAAGFWLLQTLNAEYEADFTYPVKLRGVPKDVIITSEPTSELHVRLRDRGTVLFNYLLTKKKYPVNIEFADYKAGDGNHVRILSSSLEKKLLAQLNVSTRVISFTPDTLDFIYAAGASKRIPVALQGRVNAERQYYITDTIFTPDSVQVYAPQNVLDTLEVARTQQVLWDNIVDTLKRTLPLMPPRGAKFVPSTVDLVLPVDVYTEKTVEVPVEGVNFPAGKLLRTFPAKVSIIFQVGLKHFRHISADDFHIEVAYDELTGADKCTLKLKTVPKGVRNVRIEPAQVDFLIEQVTPDNGY